jgi:predicted membrane channel-forming protein YqfA (hemolysin III family)
MDTLLSVAAAGIMGAVVLIAAQYAEEAHGLGNEVVMVFVVAALGFVIISIVYVTRSDQHNPEV